MKKQKLSLNLCKSTISNLNIFGGAETPSNLNACVDLTDLKGFTKRWRVSCVDGTCMDTCDYDCIR